MVVEDPDTTDWQLAWSPCVWKSVVARRATALTSTSVTNINRCGHGGGHCQMQYSKTRRAPHRCDYETVDAGTTQQCLRSWDDRQHRHTPVIATLEGAGHRPQATHDSTRDFKSSYSSLSQRCLARHPASRVGQSHTLRHSQHEAYCRPNLGDILDTRLLRNLILEHEKKFSDLSQSRLVNIPNVHIYFHNNHVRNSNAGYRHVILLVQFQWVVLL